MDLFSYALNNPLLLVDRTGEDVSVFYISPGGEAAKEAMGHSALWVTTRDNPAGRGLSYGGNDPRDLTKEQFIKSYTDKGRIVVEFVLQSTPEQDSKVLEFVAANPNGNTEQGSPLADAMITQNCTTAVGNALEAGGIVSPGQSPPGSGLVFDYPDKLFADLSVYGTYEDLVVAATLYLPTKPAEVPKPEIETRDAGGR